MGEQLGFFAPAPAPWPGRVVNIKDGDRYDVYVGRGPCPQRGKPGRWGNPFTDIPHVAEKHGLTLVASRDEAIACYEQHLRACPDRMAVIARPPNRTKGHSA